MSGLAFSLTTHKVPQSESSPGRMEQRTAPSTVILEHYLLSEWMNEYVNIYYKVIFGE